MSQPPNVPRPLAGGSSELGDRLRALRSDARVGRGAARVRRDRGGRRVVPRRHRAVRARGRGCLRLGGGRQLLDHHCRGHHLDDDHRDRGRRRRRGARTRCRDPAGRRARRRRDPRRGWRRGRSRPRPPQPRRQGGRRRPRRGAPAGRAASGGRSERGHRRRRSRRNRDRLRRAAPAAASSTSTPRRPTSSKRLPGIGPTLAAAIVDERERNGPFDSVDDLNRVPGIGDGRLGQIRDLVTV